MKMSGCVRENIHSIMHDDIQPFSPISSANSLLRIIDIDRLHDACLVAGLAALVLIGIRHLLRD